MVDIIKVKEILYKSNLLLITSIRKKKKKSFTNNSVILKFESSEIYFFNFKYSRNYLQVTQNWKRGF